MESHSILIHLTKAECYHAHPNETIDIELPPYGNIRRIRIQLQLEGGIAESFFQPVGYSSPDSDCKGGDFTPPPNQRHRIKYLDYSAHLREKEDWESEALDRAVVTYQVSARVVKKTGYVTNIGRQLVIPNMLSIVLTQILEQV